MTTLTVTGCRIVETAEELAAHRRIRHQVFVVEQKLFPGTDRDAHDDDPATVCCLGFDEGTPVGAVRLYPCDPGGEHWQGDRLAVLTGHRGASLGGPLVRLAVATARSRGGRVMTAHVQLPNVRFFERLGWHRDGPEEIYVGVAHQPMAISLGGRS
jgi:putative N-acetyltransferase (TIGR04045 family)